MQSFVCNRSSGLVCSVVRFWLSVGGRLFRSCFSVDSLLFLSLVVRPFYVSRHAIVLIRPCSPECIHLCSLSFVRGHPFVMIFPIRSCFVVACA